jgi:ribosome biogenesis protein Nip4
MSVHIVKADYFYQRAFLANMALVSTVILDKIYFCTKCKATFLFKEDVQEHIEQTRDHNDFRGMPLE